MAIKYAPHTQTTAAARAKGWVGRSKAKGWCQAWVVADIFGTGGVGDWDGDRAADAEDGWKKAVSKGKVVKASAIKDVNKLPAGLALYWSGGSNDNGHAAVSAGDGQIYSTDLPTSGKIGKVSLTAPATKWGLTFLGYALVEGNGYTLTDEPLSADNPPAPATAVWGKPETWRIGSIGPDVTRLGQQLEKWAAHYGLPKPYTVGPSPEFTETDRRAVEAFQRKQGWTGAAADGFPGAETFTRLAGDPSKPSPQTTLDILHWNVAGSDEVNGYEAENATRGPAVGAYARSIGFDVLMTCEASQDNLRAGISKGLGTVGRTVWEQRAKAIWFDATEVKNFSARKAYSDNLFAYLGTVKWGAAFFGEKDATKFSVLEIHTDYRKPAKQAKQVQSIFKKWRKDTDARGILRANCFVVMDGNWDGTSGDNPFKALEGWNFVEKGSRTKVTFMERKHLDAVLAHEDAEVVVSVKPRANAKGVKLSDHNPVKAVAVLK